MFGGIKKVPTTCPHCGFVQLEPAGLISTYCRSCGDHYTVRRDPVVSESATPSIATRLRTKWSGPRQRHVTCTACESTHRVSAACGSTLCPTCGTTIDLGDVAIAGHSTRSLDTRGTVHIARNAYLNASSTVCENAFVEGRIAGRVRCSGTLRLRGSGLCRAQIRTRRLLIDRGTQLRFTHSLFAEEILIRGTVEADVQCAGTIRIGRHGSLEGNVQARAMTVDKGGAYLGSVQVTGSWTEPEEREKPGSFPRLEVMPAWRSAFAFAW